MAGVVTSIPHALVKPMLIMGVEKRLMLINAMTSFLLVASTRLQLPASLLGVAFFVMMHALLAMLAKYDPYMGVLFRRATRYSLQAYYPAVASVYAERALPVETVSRAL